MKVLTDPVTHLSETYGWAGWVHWETSGAHFYAWDTPRLFFSVDVYTCKPFDAAVAAEFTRKALGASVITFKEF
jgi:S-adenosylmethionine decarboxylase